MDAISVVRLVLAVLLLVVLAMIGIVDIYLAWKWGPDATVSAVFQQWARDWPILPMMMGVLMGHLLWPLRLSNGQGLGKGA